MNMITFKPLIIFIVFNLFIYLKFDFFSKLIGIYDKPDNSRKIHTIKTSVSGGVIIFLNLILIFILSIFFDFNILEKKFFSLNRELFSFFGLATMFFLFGLIDDKYDLTANAKLTFFVALIVFAILLDPNLLIEEVRIFYKAQPVVLLNLSLVFSIISYLLFINSYNMFDGVNLQAGLYALGILVIFILKDQHAAMCFFLIISISFFLLLNFQKKVFLGNNGSFLIAYIISYIFVKSYNVDRVFLADEIFLIMLVPGLEVFRLFFKRIINNKHPFFPDNDHIHHRLLKRMNHKKSQFLLQTLIFLPVIINSFVKFSYIFILVSTFIYFVLLRYTKK